MKDFRYKYIGSFNVESILKNLQNSDWEEWTYKQDTFEVHSHTKNLSIIKNEEYNETPGSKTKNYILIKKDLENIESLIKNSYGDGIILSTEIVNLPAGKKVDRHVDEGYSLETNPRIHLVLQTNDNVIFKVDGEDKNMKLGEMWEINNTKLHSVENNGDIDRIHMIIDYKKINTSLF